MSNVDDVRNANRQAALGSAMDPSRIALSRPEVRAAFEEQQQQQKQFEADMEKQRKLEEARKLAARNKIEGMRRSKGKGADKVTTSGSEVVEKRLYSFANQFGRTISPIQARLEQAEADLARARVSGNPIQIQDAAARVKAAMKDMEKEYSSPQFREGVELAKDYTYYLEGKDAAQEAKDARAIAAGKAVPRRGGLFTSGMSLGEKIGTTIGMSFEKVQRREAKEKSREENLKDPSSMAFRLAYRDKFGKDPVDVKVMDKTGKEVSITRLGLGVTPESANKYVTEYEKFKAEKKDLIKDAVQDYVQEQAKAWIEANPGLDLKFSNVRVYYDKQGNPTDAKGNPLINEQGVLNLGSIMKPPEITERTRGAPGKQVTPPDTRFIRTYENLLAVAPGTAEAYAKANNLTSWLQRNPVGVPNPDINNTAVGVTQSAGSVISNFLGGNQRQPQPEPRGPSMQDQSMISSIASFGQSPPPSETPRGVPRNSLLEMISI